MGVLTDRLCVLSYGRPRMTLAVNQTPFYHLICGVTRQHPQHMDRPLSNMSCHPPARDLFTSTACPLRTFIVPIDAFPDPLVSKCIFTAQRPCHHSGGPASGLWLLRYGCSRRR